MIRENIQSRVLIVVIIFLLVIGIAGKVKAQGFYPYPFLGLNPFFTSYPAFPFAYAPPIFPVNPFIGAPLVAPPAPLSRIGAATIIVTNPTAGTVSVINPTVATAPTVTTASPPPLLSLLGTIYASALYEGALSTANPLLFALLQNLFL